MPFKSKAQRRWMYANDPEMAREWESHTKGKKLPERVKGKAMHGAASGPWKPSAPKVPTPKHTRVARPAPPAQPAKPLVAFASSERMINEMHSKARAKSKPMSAGGFTRAEAQRVADLMGLDFEREGFTLDAFREGLNVELEHGDVTHKRAIATGKIARAHLRERPDYYAKLRKLERSPMVGKARASMYQGAGASPAPRDPIPDYADIYWQPEGDDNRVRERVANENRRASVSARNKGKFGFHGGADVEPALRYDPDDFARVTRRGNEQAPAKRANTSVADLNAYDQPVTLPKRALVVKRNEAPVQERAMSGPQREPQRITKSSGAHIVSTQNVGTGRKPKAARSSGARGVTFSATNEALHTHKPVKPKVADAPNAIKRVNFSNRAEAVKTPKRAARPQKAQRPPAYLQMAKRSEPSIAAAKTPKPKAMKPPKASYLAKSQSYVIRKGSGEFAALGVWL